MAALFGSFPTSQCQWMNDLTDSVIVHVDGDGRSTLLENMLAEQHDSACQDSERTSSRANESSAADKDPSHWKELSQYKDQSHGSRREGEHHTGGAASHKRQREEPSETNSNKANREKIRRDRLNDRFEELARALERSELARADRGSILVDAVRVLAQLRAETSRLRGSAQHMSEQIQELKAEKSELREERARLLANKQQLEDEVRRLAASGAAQSTAATSATASMVSSASRSTAAVSPPLGFAACAPGSPGAVSMMLHPVCEPGKLGPMGAPMGLMPVPFMPGGMLHPLSPPHSHLHRPQPRSVQGKCAPAGNHLGTGHPVPSHPAAAAAAAGDGGSAGSAGASGAASGAADSPAAAATGGSAGSAGAAGSPAAAASGPQYLHVPAMPYAMSGMPPMGMWQWLPQSPVESPYDQKLRTLVV
ncbi:unnamed protein product [Closterium sp. Naga37s-1]|nr:unnamed protein product [Closterium sp. Naga37s-1]